MDDVDSAEEPNLNSGTPWSAWDDQDIRWGLDHDSPIEEIANFLCRTPSEIRQRIEEIAEADAIGDPSLLHDGLTHRERIALETYRDARAAMPLIREAVEECAPPGSVPACRLSDPRIHRGGRGAGTRRLCYRQSVPPHLARSLVRLGDREPDGLRRLRRKVIVDQGRSLLGEKRWACGGNAKI